MAAGKKNARRLKAWIVFIDETGLLMAPLVRRTWAPRGRTPILQQRSRTREKVSLIATLTVSPIYHRVGLYFSLYPNANITTVEIETFLRNLARHLPGPIFVIWDRLRAHASQDIAVLLYRNPRLHLVFLPPYAPELNPSEMLWGYLKMNPLANLAADDAESLSRIASRQLKRLGRKRHLLRSLIEATPLSSCLA